MNIKEAIQTAIQMEKDGYAFYKKAASQTSNEMGSKIFESIAADELLHLNIFEKLFDETIGKKEWDILIESNKKYKKIPIFPKDLKQIEGIDPDTNELDALHIAMDSEQEAIDFYTKIRADSTNEEVQKIINIIIEQEKNHYNILNEEFNHLGSTGYWYEMDYLGG